MKNEMLLAVNQLAAERNLSHSVVVSAIKSALENAYKRDVLAKGQDVKVDLNPTTGKTVVRTVRRVVEEIENANEEIALSEAQKQFKEVKVGDEITTGFIEHNPGRIAAQTAKQIVIQKYYIIWITICIACTKCLIAHVGGRRYSFFTLPVCR